MKVRVFDCDHEKDLEESINKYTKAMKLINECDTELKNVEEQVSKMVSENGLEEKFEIENMIRIPYINSFNMDNLFVSAILR